ncbi:MAG: apolipoprotein N-acyltransferase, partial [Gemmataceae bacterium]
MLIEWAERAPAWCRWLGRTWTYQLGFFREMWQASLVAIMLAGLVAYGATRIQHPPFEKGPRIAAIQADIPQDLKMQDQDELFRRYDELTLRVAARADLVIWPETCYPISYVVVHPNTDSASASADFRKDVIRSRTLLEKSAQRWKTNVLLGVSGFEWEAGTEWRYNMAVLLERDGTVKGRYDKMHLVPFGEYVPFKSTFPWLQAFTPYKGDYSCRPGESYTKFLLPVAEKSYRFGALICYEDSDPSIARKYVTGPEPVDFLVNQSNDGWFRGTEEHEQHLAICRFRAIETRRTVVRAVNMGISAFIDPDGRVVALPGDSWALSKRMDGTVTDRVPLDTRTTIYSEYGDWFPLLCWVITGLGLLTSLRKR